MGKRLLLGLVMLVFFSGWGWAREATKSASVRVEVATDSAVATPAGMIAQIVSSPKQDLTQPTESKSPLQLVLEKKQLGKLSWNNFLQVAIRRAVDAGVPVNIVVLMILFPLIAALIAGARQIVGLQGFGIFTPAVVAVAFLATGVSVGVLLFVGILVVATVARVVLRRLRLPTLPRTALLLWFVSLGVLGLILASPVLKLAPLMNINIFPVLVLILLAETFIDVQVTQSSRAAIRLTFETFVLALVSFLIMSTTALQEWVLLNPEIAVLLIALLDIVIGKYDGLRLLEMYRFRKLVAD